MSDSLNVPSLYLKKTSDLFKGILEARNIPTGDLNWSNSFLLTPLHKSSDMKLIKGIFGLKKNLDLKVLIVVLTPDNKYLHEVHKIILH